MYFSITSGNNNSSNSSGNSSNSSSNTKIFTITRKRLSSRSSLLRYKIYPQ